MAESKYLDRGGVEYLWSKVKAYLDSRFGTGIIKVTTEEEIVADGSKPQILIGPNTLFLSNGSNTSSTYKLIYGNNSVQMVSDQTNVKVGGASEVEIINDNNIAIYGSSIKLRSARLYLEQASGIISISESRGIALLYLSNNNISIYNSAGKTLRLCLVSGSTVTSRDLNANASVNISNGILTLLFWSVK